jgi:hypothetical protein
MQATVVGAGFGGLAAAGLYQRGACALLGRRCGTWG